MGFSFLFRVFYTLSNERRCISMKNLINVILTGAAACIGFGAGGWLWDNVLEDKLDDLKDRLAKKREEA